MIRLVDKWDRGVRGLDYEHLINVCMYVCMNVVCSCLLYVIVVTLNVFAFCGTPVKTR